MGWTLPSGGIAEALLLEQAFVAGVLDPVRDREGCLAEAKRNRRAGMLSATMGLSDRLWLAIEVDGNTLLTLRIDPAAEEAP